MRRAWIRPLPAPYPGRRIDGSGIERRRLRVSTLRRVTAESVHSTLSEGQLTLLAEHGEERTAAVGETSLLGRERSYPFIAIIEGEAAVHDAAGHEIVRHGASRLPRRDEPALRADRLPDRGRDRADALHRRRARRRCGRCCSRTARSPTCCSPPSSSAARCCRRARASGSRSIGPRSSAATRRLVEFARRSRLPYHVARPDAPTTGGGGARSTGSSPSELPLVRLPGGAELRQPEQRRALAGARRSGSSSARARRSTCSSSAAARPGSAPPSTAPRRGSTRSSSRAPCSAARPAPRAGSRTTSASRPASAAPS